MYDSAFCCLTYVRTNTHTHLHTNVNVNYTRDQKRTNSKILIQNNKQWYDILNENETLLSRHTEYDLRTYLVTGQVNEKCVERILLK